MHAVGLYFRGSFGAPGDPAPEVAIVRDPGAVPHGSLAGPLGSLENPVSESATAVRPAALTAQPVAPAARALDLEVLRQFRMVFATVRRHFSDVEKACGISGSLLWALSVADEHDGLRVTELAAALAIHQSTASNMVEQLAQRGLLLRERSVVDGRVVQLRVTPAGRALLARAPKPARGKLAHALGALALGDLQALHADMTRLIAGMQLREEDAAVPLTDT